MRTKNSAKNLITTIIPFVIIGLLGFVRVKIFVGYLGEDISSINQLFYNILAYLSLAESGIGVFVVQKYYQCFVDDNREKINVLYSTSKVFFRRVAYFMLVAGALVSFFLPLLTNADLSILYLQIVFMVFLFKNVIDYFMYAPRLVIEADQKMYKVNLWIYLIRVLEIIAEIIFVMLGFDYLVVLIPGIIIRLVINLIINRKIQKLYPWLKDIKEYHKEEIKGIKNLIHQKISGLLYNNTDILLVSSFLNPVSVIIYSSYNYVTKYLYDVGYMIAQAISSSMGNVLHKEEETNQFKIFNQINVLFYFVAGIFTVLFLAFINPFVKLWMGEKYFMSDIGVVLISTIMYFNIARRAILMTKDNLGLFKQTKYVILLEAILNLVFSVILIQWIGLEGVLLATVLSTLITTFWYIPKYIYQNRFHKNFMTYIGDYALSFLFTYVLAFFLMLWIPKNISNFFIWGIWAIVFGFIAFLLSFLFYYITFPSFRELCEKGKYFIMQKGGTNEKDR